jgi:hypothetical protein
MQSGNIMKSHFFTNNTLASSRLKLRLRAECAEPHDQRHISQLAASFLPPCEKLNPDLHTHTQNTAPASETDAFHRDLQRQEHHPANTESRSSVDEEHTAQDKKKIAAFGDATERGWMSWYVEQHLVGVVVGVGAGGGVGSGAGAGEDLEAAVLG